MAARTQLEAFGRVDLDGTHRAVIQADLPGLESPDGDPIYLVLRSATATCGCLLAELRSGPEARIQLDRFKQWHLGLKDGDRVEVEVVSPERAHRVVLHAPQDFSKHDGVRFVGKTLVAGEKTALFTFSGETRLVRVRETSPEGVVLVEPGTQVKIVSTQAEQAPVTYEDIGGLSREIGRIREAVEYPFRRPELFSHLGVSPPRGIILHGPPGTGKTLIARALANECGARFYAISGPEIYSKWYGKSEQNLRNIFSEAVKNAPSLVVIDELDALVPIRERTHGDQEQRIVATFLTQMDGLGAMKDVVVVGTTNRLDAIDPALRRGGRFEYEIHVGAPDAASRLEILEIHSRRMPLDDDLDLEPVASRASGYVGADIAALCREAAYVALRRTFTRSALESGDTGDLDRLRVCAGDFERALATVPPSALKECLVEVVHASWDDVGGLDEVRRVLEENIACPARRLEAFRKAGVRPACGILLHGPPGTGKTLLARAVASTAGAHFITVRGPEIRSRWIGEAEKRIHFLFSQARQVAPCVIFFDEIDAAVPVRGRDRSGTTDAIVNQILSEMDGIQGGEGVFVMGATNRIEMLDPAVLRPGRFDTLVEVGLPDSAARGDIFRVHLRHKPLGLDVEVGQLAELTDGFSGADIAEACRAAAWSALRRSGFEADEIVVCQADLLDAVDGVRSGLAMQRPSGLLRAGGGGEP